ncbi:hypothetical protein [Rhizorhapis sp. SPR117]|uniref:hypothetical protein n=1 Tax=Rhizorhapis sp. SPR117 TaxID=2912611 RepID=UPI001F2BFE9B|nr:hypothetical protein [Rhizorhapis sp. SPR117]
MDDLDIILTRMRESPVHRGLTDMESAVIEGMAARRANAGAIRNIAVVGIVALGIGMASGQFSAGRAEASVSAAPFGVPATLAPSSLLAAGE